MLVFSSQKATHLQLRPQHELHLRFLLLDRQVKRGLPLLVLERQALRLGVLEEVVDHVHVAPEGGEVERRLAVGVDRVHGEPEVVQEAHDVHVALV